MTRINNKGSTVDNSHETQSHSRSDSVVGSEAADGRFSVVALKERIYLAFPEKKRENPHFIKFYQSDQSTQFFRLLVLYFCTLFKLEKMRKQFSAKPHDEKLETEFLVAQHGTQAVFHKLSNVYATILMEYHGFVTSQEECVFYETLTNTSIKILKAAFRDPKLHPCLIQQINRVFRSNSFNFRFRTDRKIQELLKSYLNGDNLNKTTELEAQKHLSKVRLYDSPPNLIHFKNSIRLRSPFISCKFPPKHELSDSVKPLNFAHSPGAKAKLPPMQNVSTSPTSQPDVTVEGTEGEEQEEEDVDTHDEASGSPSVGKTSSDTTPTKTDIGLGKRGFPGQHKDAEEPEETEGGEPHKQQEQSKLPRYMRLSKPRNPSPKLLPQKKPPPFVVPTKPALTLTPSLDVHKMHLPSTFGLEYSPITKKQREKDVPLHRRKDKEPATTVPPESPPPNTANPVDPVQDSIDAAADSIVGNLLAMMPNKKVHAEVNTNLNASPTNSNFSDNINRSVMNSLDSPSSSWVGGKSKTLRRVGSTHSHSSDNSASHSMAGSGVSTTNENIQAASRPNLSLLSPHGSLRSIASKRSLKQKNSIKKDEVVDDSLVITNITIDRGERSVVSVSKSLSNVLKTGKMPSRAEIAKEIDEEQSRAAKKFNPRQHFHFLYDFEMVENDADDDPFDLSSISAYVDSAPAMKEAVERKRAKSQLDVNLHGFGNFDVPLDILCKHTDTAEEVPN